jgi:hypothetical protein
LSTWATKPRRTNLWIAIQQHDASVLHASSLEGGLYERGAGLALEERDRRVVLVLSEALDPLRGRHGLPFLATAEVTFHDLYRRDPERVEVVAAYPGDGPRFDRLRHRSLANSGCSDQEK